MRRGSSLVNLMRAICHNCRAFSSLTPENALPWISPLHFMKATPSKPDSPIENPSTLVGFNRKPKFISHESAINLIKGEKDPEHALDIFNFVAEQKGFRHNHATYSTILHKLGQAKKFKAVDALKLGLILELAERGFKAEPHTWALLIELTCRERKLLFAFELLDELVSNGFERKT